MDLNINNEICPSCGIELENGSCLECGFVSDELKEDDLDENGFSADKEE